MTKIDACSHEKPLFNAATRAKVVRLLMKYCKLHNEKFDAIAVSGYSMTIVGSILADKLKKNLVVVRKPTDRRNSSYDVEGIHGQKCLFIDDLISSGDTFKRVRNGLKEIDCEVIGIMTWRCYTRGYDIGEGVAEVLIPSLGPTREEVKSLYDRCEY